MQTPKSILITGAGGYLGSRLTGSAVGSGHSVVAVDTFQGGKQGLSSVCISERIKIKKCSVSELAKEDLHGVGQIIHLAAIVGSAACEKNPEEALKTNLEATIHLCHLAEDIPIYFTNTNIGYPQGDSDETAEQKSDSIYARTKIEAEKVILEHGGVSLRLASVFGLSPNMRDDLLVHFLIREFLTQDFPILLDLGSLRNFVHINDVCRALLYPQGLKRGEAYNVALERHYRKRDLVDLITPLTGIRKDTRCGDGKDPDKRDYHCSVKKIKQHAGFMAETTLESALPELVRYYEFATL